MVSNCRHSCREQVGMRQGDAGLKAERLHWDGEAAQLSDQKESPLHALQKEPGHSPASQPSSKPLRLLIRGGCERSLCEGQNVWGCGHGAPCRGWGGGGVAEGSAQRCSSTVQHLGLR